MQLHNSTSNYVLVLEFHDDVLVLEPADEPRHADFFQVKTKREGQWKQGELLSMTPRRNGRRGNNSTKRKSRQVEVTVHDQATDNADAPLLAPRSILGKLLDHVQRFPGCVRTLNVVSNATFKLDLATNPESKDRERFSVSDLSENALAEVKAALRAELGLAEDPPLERMFLIVTGISLTQHETHGAGRLAEFLESRYPHKQFRSSALFRNLMAEISRRSGPEWKPTSYAELLKKGISRSDFEDWISSAVKDDPEEKLSQVRERLNSELVDLKLWVVVERAWRTYVVGRMNHADTMFQEFVSRAQQATTATWRGARFSGLLGFLAEAESRFVASFGEPLLPLSRDLLKGAILFEFKSIETGQLQTTGAEPAPQGK